MIECAIDLVKFADSPFVIERPADADFIADAATRILARSGLRLDFGIARTTAAHADIAKNAFLDNPRCSTAAPGASWRTAPIRPPSWPGQRALPHRPTPVA
jgi:hypothetical protein